MSTFTNLLSAYYIDQMLLKVLNIEFFNNLNAYSWSMSQLTVK